MASMKTLRYLALLALFIGMAVAPGIAARPGWHRCHPRNGDRARRKCRFEVSVAVEGTNIVAVTGRDGKYRIAPVPVGEHTLTFSYLGLQSATADVTVVAGEAGDPGHDAGLWRRDRGPWIATARRPGQGPQHADERRSTSRTSSPPTRSVVSRTRTRPKPPSGSRASA